MLVGNWNLAELMYCLLSLTLTVNAQSFEVNIVRTVSGSRRGTVRLIKWEKSPKDIMPYLVIANLLNDELLQISRWNGNNKTDDTQFHHQSYWTEMR